MPHDKPATKPRPNKRLPNPKTLDDLRGPDLATLLHIREQSMREAVGGPLVRSLQPFSERRRQPARSRFRTEPRPSASPVPPGAEPTPHASSPASPR